MNAGPLRIGVVGPGSVVDSYMAAVGTYPDVDVRAVADRHPERTRSRAAKYGPTPLTVEELLGSRDIEAVLNLTPPASHSNVSMAAVTEGKHLYSEKPLATTVEQGSAILAAADQRSLVVGSAPDITLGRSFRASLRQLSGGLIGEVVFARCDAVLSGPERWHPRPQFLYARGAAPSSTSARTTSPRWWPQ